MKHMSLNAISLSLYLFLSLVSTDKVASAPPYPLCPLLVEVTGQGGLIAPTRVRRGHTPGRAQQGSRKGAALLTTCVTVCCVRCRRR